MKRIMAIMAMTVLALSASAQRYVQDPEFAKQQNEKEMAARTAKVVKKDDIKRMYVRCEDGEYCYEAVYDDEEKTFGMAALQLKRYNWAPSRHGYRFLTKGARLLREDNKNLTITHEIAGTWDMLVVRNVKTSAVEDIFLLETDGNPSEMQFQQDIYDLLDGVYALASVEKEAHKVHSWSTDGKAYFGSIWFAEHPRQQSDPGAYRYMGDGTIEFGEGRMKDVPEPPMPKFEVRQGDDGRPHYFMDDVELPNEEEWRREREAHIPMPGHGGHGAIMGPTSWHFQLTENGMKVKADLQEYIPYYPCFGEEFTLTKERGAYEGVDGVWPVASVRPLTRGMLKMMTKEGLQLMLNEVYARHGQSFKDPKVQKYFDAQSWYKKAKQPSALTPIEKLNVSFLKSFIKTK